MQQIDLVATPQVWTVSDLTRQLRNLLEQNFAEVWVVGEVSNFKSPASGHFYFTLKDAEAQLLAVMFRGANGKLPFRIEDGQELVCHGRISVYEPRGQYQIIVDTCEPKGIGALQLAFEQLKKKLESEGLFRPERKKPLPFLPQKIGIVTSSTGAAIRDILKVLQRRFPLPVVLFPVKVQGEGAAEEIAHAIEVFNRWGGCDVLIVGRGGGSLEDLWAFNAEVVARAIFSSKIPVISAVGHEIDFTIADFVADVRAPTPSAAAEIVVPNRDDLFSTVAELKRQLVRYTSSRIPDLLICVDGFRERLAFGMKTIFTQQRQTFSQLVGQLEILSPLAVLSKGYSVVRKVGTGEAIRAAKELRPGDIVEMVFAKGKTTARVER